MRTTGLFYALAPLFARCAPMLGICPVFMMQLLCFAMFACAYNLLLGFGRMLSFWHAAFFGSAAYATSWLVTTHAWGPAAAILDGVLVSAILRTAICALAIARTRHHSP